MGFSPIVCYTKKKKRKWKYLGTQTGVPTYTLGSLSVFSRRVLVRTCQKSIFAIAEKNKYFSFPLK